MTDLSRYFSSQAKYKVLEILSQQREPTPLRHIAALANLPVRSVELALHTLVKDRVIRQRPHSRYSLFELNETHSSYRTLMDLFSFLRNRNIEQRAKSFKPRAVNALQFASQAQNLFRSARST